MERSVLETGPEDVVWQGFSPAFDMFVEESWVSIAGGAQLAIGSRGECQNVPGLGGSDGIWAGDGFSNQYSLRTGWLRQIGWQNAATIRHVEVKFPVRVRPRRDPWNSKRVYPQDNGHARALRELAAWCPNVERVEMQWPAVSG